MTMFWAAPPAVVDVEDLQEVRMSSTTPRIPKIRSGNGLKGRMRASWRAMVTEKIFFV